MGALLESVKTDKLQNAFIISSSALKEDAKKAEKKVLSESQQKSIENKAEATEGDSKTADIVYLQKLAGIS